MDHARPPHPTDMLWQPGTLVSVFAAGELLAAIHALGIPTLYDALLRFGLMSFAIQWCVVLTLGGMYALRGWLRAQSWPAVAAFAMGLLCVVTWLSIEASWRILGPVWSSDPSSWRAAGLRFLLSMIAMMLFGLLALRGEWESRRLALLAKQYELDALRARVNPHFLYNALNTAAALVPTRPERAEQTLLDLSDLFRAALSGREAIALSEEITLTRRYLDIETLRIEPPPVIAWHVPEPLPATQVPTLALQTLVENAIHHGVAAPDGTIRIDIEVTRDTDVTVLRVRNAYDPARPGAHAGHQVGLAATAARVEALTFGRGDLRTRAADGEFSVEIRLPIDDP